MKTKTNLVAAGDLTVSDAAFFTGDAMTIWNQTNFKITFTK